jgi:hypothetical protein
VEKSWGIAETDHKPSMNNDRVAIRICHLKGHLFKIGLVNSTECGASRHLKQPHKFFVTAKHCQP